MSSVGSAYEDRPGEPIESELVGRVQGARLVISGASTTLGVPLESVILDRVGIHPPASSAAVSKDQSREHSATWSLEDEVVPGMGMFG